MTLTSYDLMRGALALFRSRWGNESLNQQCIRFDGWYAQEVYQGNEAIRSYPTATEAADDSPMYTRDVNDPNAQPGDPWYWWWDREGHVGTVLGHDASGRVLVTHTSSSGDLVEQWTNNVRISHADTIPHRFRGGSHHYGVNTRRAGLTAWPIKPAPKPLPTPTPAPTTGEPIMAFKSIGIGYRPEEDKDRLVSVALDYETGQQLGETILTKSYGESFYKATTEGGFVIISKGHYDKLLAEFPAVVAAKRSHELAVAAAKPA